MAVMCALLLVGMGAQWVWKHLRDRRERIAAERDATEDLLRNGFRFDTAEPDPVGAAFEDYQKAVADILDRDPVRREELIRDLEAATAIWEKAEFDAAVKPLRRDLAFWFAIRRAKKATT